MVSNLEKPEGGGTSPVRVSVVKQANVPTAPVSPRTKLNIALGLLVGLAVGVGGAVLRESLDTGQGPEDLHDSFGIPSLGVVAYDPEATNKPLVVQTDPMPSRAEAFRQLRTNLQFANIDGNSRCLVVTSAVPGEGKSTSACNLAITMAQAGLRVLLVEADLRRSAVADYLGVEDAVGITSVLIGQADLDDAIQDWGGGLMHVLPGGPMPPNPSELLGSQAMADLLGAARTMYDVVLIDAPPLLPVTDAAVVSTAADGAILVVRHGKTKREQVKRALESLAAVDSRVLGAVLNMAPMKGREAYYYGYGYRYDGARQGGSAPNTQPRPASLAARDASPGEGSVGHDTSPSGGWPAAYPSERRSEGA